MLRGQRHITSGIHKSTQLLAQDTLRIALDQITEFVNCVIWLQTVATGQVDQTNIITLGRGTQMASYTVDGESSSAGDIIFEFKIIGFLFSQ